MVDFIDVVAHCHAREAQPLGNRAVDQVEHYEIASYGTITALAKAAGQQEVAELLVQTLQEEKKTDELLTGLAESEINPAAIQAMQEPDAASDKRGASKKSA